jgi:hypothetical protein
MASDKLTNNNLNNFAEDAEAFFAMLAQFIKMKEGHPHNHNYQWSVKDILYIQAALDEMTEVQRSAFRAHFRDYQIVKILPIPRQGAA